MIKMAQRGQTNAENHLEVKVLSERSGYFFLEHDKKSKEDNGDGYCFWAKPQQPALLESLNQQPHWPKLNILLIYNSLHFI